jgi:hypothetical protein
MGRRQGSSYGRSATTTLAGVLRSWALRLFRLSWGVASVAGVFPPSLTGGTAATGGTAGVFSSATGRFSTAGRAPTTVRASPAALPGVASPGVTRPTGTISGPASRRPQRTVIAPTVTFTGTVVVCRIVGPALFIEGDRPEASVTASPRPWTVAFLRYIRQVDR